MSKEKGKLRKIFDVLAGREPKKKIFGIKEAGEILNMTAGKGAVDSKLLRDVAIDTAYCLGAKVEVIEQGMEEKEALTSDIESTFNVTEGLMVQNREDIKNLQEQIVVLRNIIEETEKSSQRRIDHLRRREKYIQGIMNVFNKED